MSTVFIDIPAPPDMSIRSFDEESSLRHCGQVATEAAKIYRQQWKRPNYYKRRRYAEPGIPSLPRPVDDDLSIAKAVRQIAGNRWDKASYQTGVNFVQATDGGSFMRAEFDRPISHECGNVDRGGAKHSTLESEHLTTLKWAINGAKMVEASLDDLIRAVRRASVFGEYVTISTDQRYLVLSSKCATYGEGFVNFPCRVEGWARPIHVKPKRLIDGLQTFRKIIGEDGVITFGYASLREGSIPCFLASAGSSPRVLFACAAEWTV